jgi:hypothetical protein
MGIIVGDRLTYYGKMYLLILHFLQTTRYSFNPIEVFFGAFSRGTIITVYCAHELKFKKWKNTYIFILFMKFLAQNFSNKGAEKKDKISHISKVINVSEISFFCYS